MSARAAANRKPLELAIASLTRSPPNSPAKISGTSTMARTFHRTGQLLGDQAGGRFAVAPELPGAAAISVGAASTGPAGRLNMVMRRLRGRRLRRHCAPDQTRGS
ncbi:hypothetical protein MSIM_14370 [Mycobacterium simiae]|nr:hypothetical protein MSIM_14370 [Mycobacterium simiae]